MPADPSIEFAAVEKKPGKKPGQSVLSETTLKPAGESVLGFRMPPTIFPPADGDGEGEPRSGEEIEVAPLARTLPGKLDLYQCTIRHPAFRGTQRNSRAPSTGSASAPTFCLHTILSIQEGKR